MVQFGCSLCIICTSLLHACLALYVDQVNDQGNWCVRGAWKSCVETSQCQALTSIFLGSSSRARLYRINQGCCLLPPTKSVTQAKRQDVMFGCLEDVCLPILHCRRCIPLATGIYYLTGVTKYQLHVRLFLPS
jgi:hypothetical protein